MAESTHHTRIWTRDIMRGCVYAAIWALAAKGLGEVVTDGTIGTAGPLGKGVILDGPAFVIPGTLGQQKGGNLFHSFSAFNLSAGESATFTGPADVSNILARITSGQESSINGQISSTIQGANLYLINPSGIVFGKDASVNVSGSFVATSADSVALGPQGRFHALPSGDDILTSAPPSAFGFLGNNPGTITNSGTLIVKESKNIALIGGNVTLRSPGLVSAASGTVHLLAVRSPGELELDIRDRSADADLSNFATLGNVGIISSSGSVTTVQAGLSKGGRVSIRGGRLIASNAFIIGSASEVGEVGGIDIRMRDAISLGGSDTVVSATARGDSGESPLLRLDSPAVSITGGATVSASSFSPSGKAGPLTINTSTFTLAGGLTSNAYGSGGGPDIAVTSDSFSVRPHSFIISDSSSAGNGGALLIDVSGRLTVESDSQILSLAAGAGRGGSIAIKAASLAILGDSTLEPGQSAGIISSTDRSTTGQGGNLSLDVAGEIRVTDGGLIQAGTRGAAGGGSVSITADSLALSGSFTQVGSAVFKNFSGNGGDLSIHLRSGLHLSNGAAILAETQGSGMGGNLVIEAGLLNLEERSSIGVNSIGPVTAGRAGDLRLTIAGAVEVHSGSQITRSTTGPGTGGDLHLSAESLTISGVSGTLQPGIAAESLATKAGGAGGNIQLDILGPIAIEDGGLISTTTLGSGAGGDLTIKADNLTVSGDRSGVTSQTKGQFTSAAGGDIAITLSGPLTVISGGNITANSFGLGSSGNVAIVADSIKISPDNTNLPTGITAQTEKSGDGGNLFINVKDLLELTSGGKISVATLGSGRGGMINIEAGEIVASGAGSGISAQTTNPIDGGIGGNLQIAVRGLLELTSGGVITAASSGVGNGGFVDIEAGGIRISGADAGITVEALAKGRAGDGGSISIRSGILEIFGANQNQVGIFGETVGPGMGGNIDLNVTQLIITNGGAISARSLGLGNPGDITIAASNGVTLLQGGNITATVGDVADKLRTADISINSPRLTIQDPGSSITVASTGNGTAGSIRLLSDTISLKTQAVISSASSGLGNAGSINITAAQELTVYGGAAITATVGDVSNLDSNLLPNIAITSPLVQVVNSGSRISADTTGTGSAGNIIVSARQSGHGGRIELFDGGRVTVTTAGSGEGGDIKLDAGTVELVGQSVISAETVGSGSGGDIVIAADRVTLNGLRGITGGIFASSDSVANGAVSHGNGGSISINAEALDIRGGMVISASTFTSGDGGDVEVEADAIALSGNNLSSGDNNHFDNVGIFANSNSKLPDAGPAGSIRLKAGDIRIDGGMVVSTGTAGPGDAGPLRIESHRLTMDGGGSPTFTGVFAATTGDPSEGVFGGRGGDIRITTDQLNIADGSGIASSTLGTGGAGDIFVAAKGAAISGARPLHLFGRDSASVQFAGIAASSEGKLSYGQGGNVEVRIGDLTLRDGGFVTARTAGPGQGGSVDVHSSNLRILTGGYISADTFASGHGGTVRIEAYDSILARSGRVSAETTGIGQGGSVRIVGDNVKLRDGGSISTSATNLGDAGAIRLAIQGDLALSRGSSISTTSNRSGAGLIKLKADGGLTVENSTVTVQALAGNAGSISVITPDQITLQESSIVAEAGNTGGNISLTAPSLELQSSRISANAIAGNGGVISLNIPASGVLGGPEDYVVVSDVVAQSEDSLISASSQQGVQGALLIDAPSLDLSSAIRAIEASLLDASAQFRENCAVHLSDDFSSFSVNGAGGVMAAPDELQSDFPNRRGIKAP